jgi:hypothetical protein
MDLPTLRGAFPDLHSRLDAILSAEGDTVVTRDTWAAPTADRFSASHRPTER